jgi:translation initiation factor IF-1
VTIENDPRDAGRRSSGSSRGAIEVEGTVREALPYAQYRVEIDGARQVVAHAPGGAGRNFIRVLIGDRVRLELAPKDLTRGRIVAVIR